MDALEHLDHGHVGAAVQRAPERADPGGGGGKQVGAAGRHHAHGGGAAVLLVVGVQQQEEIERLRDLRERDVRLVGGREHHVQEILAIRQVAPRMDVRQTPAGAVRVGRDRAHLRDDHRRGRLVGLEVALVVVGRQVGIVGAQRIQHGRKDRHRMGVARKALEQVLHARVNGRVLCEQLGEPLALRRERQLPVDDEVGCLDEGGMLGELFDGIAAVAEDAGLTVDEGDRTLAGTGVSVTLVVGDVTGIVAQVANVHRLFALRTDHDGEAILYVVEFERGVGGHGMIKHQLLFRCKQSQPEFSAARRARRG